MSLSQNKIKECFITKKKLFRKNNSIFLEPVDDGLKKIFKVLLFGQKRE